MNKTILSIKQSELLENLILKHGQVVTSGQIFAEAAGNWDYKQAKNLITRLVNNGWLIRIKRGVYVISDLSSRGFLTLSPYVIANLLVTGSYVSFESALQHHGMFDQLVQKTVSVATQQYKTVNLSGMAYRFVKTEPKLFFGWQDVQLGNLAARVASPEKALIDMVNFHRSHYSIDLVIEKLQEHVADIDFSRLTDYVLRFPVVTVKIFGLVYDLLGIKSDQLVGRVKPGNTHWMLPGDTKFNAKWRLYYQPEFDKYQHS